MLHLRNFPQFEEIRCRRCDCSKMINDVFETPRCKDWRYGFKSFEIFRKNGASWLCYASLSKILPSTNFSHYFPTNIVPWRGIREKPYFRGDTPWGGGTPLISYLAVLKEKAWSHQQLCQAVSNSHEMQSSANFWRLTFGLVPWCSTNKGSTRIRHRFADISTRSRPKSGHINRVN